MDSRRQITPLVALVAAYAIALQALLAGMALGVRSGQAALFAADGFCLSDPSHPDHAPLDRMPCCIAGACCQTSGEQGPLPQVADLAPRFKLTPVFFAAVFADIGPLSFDGRKRPRGPPAA